MVNIHIYKDYYLKSDSLQFILYEKRVVKEGENEGKEYEDNIGYFGTPESACVKVLDLVGRLSNATSMIELRDEYRACKDEIIRNFKWIDKDKEEIKEVVKKRRTK